MTGKGHTWVSLAFSIATYKMGLQLGMTGAEPFWSVWEPSWVEQLLTGWKYENKMVAPL